jgi:hypothetical protein
VVACVGQETRRSLPESLPSFALFGNPVPAFLRRESATALPSPSLHHKLYGKPCPSLQPSIFSASSWHALVHQYHPLLAAHSLTRTCSHVPSKISKPFSILGYRALSFQRPQPPTRYRVEWSTIIRPSLPEKPTISFDLKYDNKASAARSTLSCFDCFFQAKALSPKSS